MTFQDYVLEERLEKYEAIPHLTPQEVIELKNKTNWVFNQIGSNYFAKEKILDPENKHQHAHVHVKEVDHVISRHFYNDFPRQQSNNDMSYHEDDITMRFIVDYFFGDKK